MIRWRYVLPRLLIAVAVVLAIWLGTEPVLHRFLTGVGQRIIRAKVDIDGVDASLSSADLTLNGVQIANPRNLDRNLIECQSATFDIRLGSLLERRVHVREAKLTGVEFNTKRSKSGKVDLPPLLGNLPDDMEPKLKKFASPALRQFTRILAQDLREEALSMELAKELATRWPQKYAELEKRAAAFADRVKEIQEELEKGDVKSKGSAASVADRIAEVDRLRQEILEIGHEMERITEQVARDRDAIAIVRRHDTEVLRKKLTLRPIDPQQLSEYLLDDELAEKTKEMLSWIKMARRYWPSDLELPEADRQSGEDIVFPGLKALPRAVIDRLCLEGTLPQGERNVAWRGEMLNLTTDPQLVTQPLVIRGETLGEHPVYMQATLDRRTNVARDKVVLSLPKLAQQQRMLGRADQIAVTIPAGDMQLWAELNLEGEKLTGRMLVRQSNARIDMRLSPELHERLANRVRSATDHLNCLEAEVKMSGTLDDPSWELRSNLGPQLATTLTKALQAELDERREELYVTIDQHLAAQQKCLDELLAEQAQKIVNRTASGTIEIEGLRRQVAGRIKLPRGETNEEQPRGNPFFRR